jgi:hypothetical protein
LPVKRFIAAAPSEPCGELMSLTTLGRINRRIE